MEYEYDIALSFAGENREYVGKVAQYLNDHGVKFFYDVYEEVDLWGKDLYVHLDEIYRKKAKYCVMFLSKEYASKAWSSHERESAQARAFEQKGGYILPARFDDTVIPGIRPTTKYIDLRNKSPEEFAHVILSKLMGNKVVDIKKQEAFRKPKAKQKTFNPYEEAQKFINFISSELKKRCNALFDQDCSLSIFNREGHNCFRIVCGGRTMYSLDIWIGGISGDASLSFYGIEGNSSFSFGSSNAFGEVVWSREHEQTVIELTDFSLLEMLGTKRRYTRKEFLDTLWGKICDAIEIDE